MTEPARPYWLASLRRILPSDGVARPDRSRLPYAVHRSPLTASRLVHNMCISALAFGDEKNNFLEIAMSDLKSNHETVEASDRSFSAATAVSTLDGQLRDDENSLGQRLAAIRIEAGQRGVNLDGGCGGVNGGWGN